MSVCFCTRAYCRCVVSKSPQVSQVGVDKTPGAFDMETDVVVGCMGD